jgi:hypothetical protein
MTRIGKSFIVMIFLAALTVGSVTAQSGPVLIFPAQGEVLQGEITIRGTSYLPGFISYELDFAYSGDLTGTWFLIKTSNQPVDENALATWDTTTITDGDYILRLRVFLADGSSQDVMVTYLRVRNYTVIETPTPVPTSVLSTSTPTVTLVPMSYPTPTILPPNPAILTQNEISLSMIYGGAGAVGLVILLGLYLAMKRK